MSDEVAAGTMIGPYRVERELGRGGMAVVYLGRNAEGEPRAIKTLQFAGRLEGDNLERFKLEIQLLASLDHVHVVRFYEAGKLDDESKGTTIWMALEYLEGQMLRQVIRERGGRLPLEDVARWCKHIADGVAAAHAMRVVHRDLKPSNVAVVHGIAKVFDFGIAKFRRWGVKTTHHQTRLGTMGYMAPEQLASNEVDERTDVYALGVILYELASGMHPIMPADAVLTAGEAIAMTMTKVPTPLTELVPGFPDDLSAIADRALSKTPSDRYRSMLEVSDALNAALSRVRMARRDVALGNITGDWQVPSSAMAAIAGDRERGTPAAAGGAGGLGALGTVMLDDDPALRARVDAALTAQRAAQGAAAGPAPRPTPTPGMAMTVMDSPSIRTGTVVGGMPPILATTSSTTSGAVLPVIDEPPPQALGRARLKLGLVGAVFGCVVAFSATLAARHTMTAMRGPEAAAEAPAGTTEASQDTPAATAAPTAPAETAEPAESAATVASATASASAGASVTAPPPATTPPRPWQPPPPPPTKTAAKPVFGKGDLK
jgi:serine/threonine-protein kinase